MELRFPVNEIARWAAKYSYPRPQRHLTGRLRDDVRRQGHFAKAQLLDVCRWKSPRAAPKAERNPEDFVKSVTGVSISRINNEVIKFGHLQSF